MKKDSRFALIIALEKYGFVVQPWSKDILITWKPIRRPFLESGFALVILPIATRRQRNGILWIGKK